MKALLWPLGKNTRWSLPPFEPFVPPKKITHRGELKFPKYGTSSYPLNPGGSSASQ
jgi:hypothetical protein